MVVAEGGYDIGWWLKRAAAVPKQRGKREADKIEKSSPICWRFGWDALANDGGPPPKKYKFL